MSKRCVIPSEDIDISNKPDMDLQKTSSSLESLKFELFSVLNISGIVAEYVGALHCDRVGCYVILFVSLVSFHVFLTEILNHK